MQRIRFIVVKPDADPTTISWQRFAAGSIVALACMLVAFTVINAIRIVAFSASSDAPSNQSPISATTTLTPTLPLTPTTTPVGIFNATPSDAGDSENEAIFNDTTLAEATGTETIDPELTLTPQPVIPSPTAAENNPNALMLSQQQTASALEAMETPTQIALPTRAPVTQVPATPVGVATSTPQPTATSTPQPTATNPPANATATATDTTTNTPQPTATNTPNTAAHTSTPTPTPTPTPLDLPTPPNLGPFGIEINQGYVAKVIDQAQEAGVDWVRYNGILWHEVETTEGSPNWSKLETFEQEVQLMSDHGLVPVVIIRGTPAWAQQVNSACGPIKQDKLDAFASFVRTVVARYSVEPYNVRYWEIGNEPDTDPTIVDPTMPFGCWGDQNDTNYGGAYFADMLKQVSFAIKDVDSDATVILGGLLLDCDPENPPVNENKDCKPAKFLAGILENGGSSAFDMLAYHGYSYWLDEHKDWDIEHTSWKHRGGATLGKADYLRDVMEQYSVDKPILANEIGLLCWNQDPICLQKSFLADQQNYLVRTYIRAWGNNMLAASWYTFNHSNWHEAGLMDKKNQTARPALYTLAFLTNLFEGATFREQVSFSDRTREGYIFDKGSQELLVYWSNDDSIFNINIPNDATTVYTFGLTEEQENGYYETDIAGESSISVGFYPVVVVVQK